MTARRTVVGLTLLCALVFSAFAAQSASAAGTTAFTCKPSAGGAFEDNHCTKNVGAGKGSFEHVTISEGTSTETIAAPTGFFFLEGTLKSVKTKIKWGEFEIRGSTTNKIAGGVHSNEGTKLKFVFGNPTVEEPTGCTVKGGSLKFEAVKFKTSATKMELEFEPEAGAVFGEITLEGAKCAASGTFKIEGKLTTEPSGATQPFGMEASKALTMGGKAAILSGTATAQMTGESGNPIVFTTF